MDAVIHDAALERVETRSAPRCGVEPPGIPVTRFAAILAWLGASLERRRSRRMLMELTDTQLRDIGLSRVDVAGRVREIDHFRLVPANDR